MIPYKQLMNLSYMGDVSQTSNTITEVTKVPWIGANTDFFSFFALATSFLGLFLSLIDFLSDGLKINKSNKTGHVTLMLLCFIPPYLFIWIYPYGYRCNRIRRYFYHDTLLYPASINDLECQIQSKEKIQICFTWWKTVFDSNHSRKHRHNNTPVQKQAICCQQPKMLIETWQ